MRKLGLLAILISVVSIALLAAPIPQEAQEGSADFKQGELRGKTGLLRGVLKRVDPIHDQMFIRTFGGGDVRVAFDTRTELFVNDKPSRISSIPAGSVVAIDTVTESGKLFARTVRSGETGPAEINGQIVRYDSDKSLLTLSGAMSTENVVLHISPETKILNAGQSGTALKTWFPGALVACIGCRG